MARLGIGDRIDNFEFLAPDNLRYPLLKEDDGRTILLWFMRYAGCTVCRVDLHELKARIGEFEAAGARVVAVRRGVPEAAGEVEAPFEIVCDPEGALYRKYDILPAKSKLGILSAALPGKLKKAKKLGLEHGAYEGDEQQLPALFVLGADGVVRYARYASNLTDLPDLDEMLRLVKA